MGNPHYSEVSTLKDCCGGGSPPATGPGAGPGGSVKEKVTSYPDGGNHQPKDRSNGVQRCKIYPQSKGL